MKITIGLAGICLATCAGLHSAVALAQPSPAPTLAQPQVWINPGAYSRHFDRNKDLRENNIGLGAEVRIAGDHALIAGSFVNSLRVRSRYAAYMWQPLHWQVAGAQVRAGVAVGGFDGYPYYRNGDWFVAALPIVAIEGDRIGINLIVIPTIKNRVDGAMVFQLKVRVW